LLQGFILRTKKLGHTDLQLTNIGLGTWAIGGPCQFGWGPQDDSQAIAAILTALEKGINWIDTAPIYGLGHSEELIGRALRQTSQKPLIATKCSLLWDKKGLKVNCLKSGSVRRECHASLKRLGVEVIDLYQIHRPIPDEDIEEAWEEMTRLIEAGHVRYLGVSNFNAEQIERVQQIHPVASLQPLYNMLHREIEDKMLGHCAEHNIGVIVYSPMQRGLLTGSFSYERLKSLPDDDYRKKTRDFQEPLFSATLDLVEGLCNIANQNGRTPAQLAISWVLRRKEVTAAIVGARSPGQIAETVQAGGWTVADEDIEKIEQLLKQRQEKINGKQ
jgi:aryl-alcohol dehydrogenase-like predicted oxidoreductase